MVHYVAVPQYPAVLVQAVMRRSNFAMGICAYGWEKV
jgi:hypothetical protein